MTPFDAILAEHAFVVLDGGLATELQLRGCDLDDPLWSAKILLERPEQIAAVHRDYLDAGADCISTASYQATFEGLARRGLDEAAATVVLRRSVELAARERDAMWADPSRRRGRARPIVAASIGSWGAHLADGSEYRGDYGVEHDALVVFHRRRARTLATGADVLAFETVPCLLEVHAIAEVVREFDVPAWVSVSCRDGAHTGAGEPIEQIAHALANVPGVFAIGVNCIRPAHAHELTRRLVSATDKLVAVYPNSGEGWDAGARGWCGTAADVASFAAAARTWWEAGARLIGGCCRTGPAHVRALAELRALLD